MPIFRQSLIPALLLLAVPTACAPSDTGNQAATQSPMADALRQGAPDGPLRAFYEARQWQPAWTGQQADSLMEILRGAQAHGLDPASFTRDIDAAQGDAARELALSRAALAYADALARGRVDPARLFEVYSVPRPQVDVAAGLAQAVQNDNVRQWIDGLAPQDEEYRALQQAYQDARRIAAQPAPQGAPARVDGQPDPNDPRVATNRALVLAVNLERRRWLQRDAGAQRIDVNTAAAFLTYYRDGQIADRRVVVTGEPGWETPELGTPLFRLVANPDWTVPSSIENAELGRLSPAQLSRRNMTRRNGRIVQEPGPTNALGMVKFDLQNDHAIYLHDTPSKAAFDQTERHLSHGCVRVRDALGFARIIADDMGVREAFERGLATRDTEMIALPRQIPVRLLYQTAYLDNGRLVIVDDVYNWDRRVAEALGLVGSDQPAAAARRRAAGPRDMGP